MDNSEDYYRGYIQKIMILQVTQQIFLNYYLVKERLFILIRFLELLISGQIFKIIL